MGQLVSQCSPENQRIGQPDWPLCLPSLGPPFSLPWCATAKAHPQTAETLQLSHPGVPVIMVTVAKPARLQNRENVAKETNLKTLKCRGFYCNHVKYLQDSSGSQLTHVILLQGVTPL